MNAYCGQGEALSSEVINQIIEKWLSNEGTTNISRQSNLSYKTVSNIGDLLLVIRRPYLHGRFDCRDIFALPSLLNHFSII